MAEKWFKTPKHILREKCIESVIEAWKPSSFIEFGAGTGAMTMLFLERGFYGKCYDIGEESREILKKNLSRYGKNLEVIDDLKSLTGQAFDYLFAFEVLEHVTDDLKILKHWSSFLKQDGKILISVPAHMKKYNKEDEFVGHIRRYEKMNLHNLLKEAGYENITILNYGFPLGNLTRYISNLLHSDDERSALSSEEKSIKSGIERSKKVRKLSFLVHERIILPFAVLQRLFFNQDWGDGYVAYAEKQ